MKATDCIKAVKSAAPSLTDKDIEDIFTSVQRKQQRDRSNALVLDNPSDLTQWGKDEAARLQHIARVKKHQAALNIKANREALADINNYIAQVKSSPRFKTGDKALSKRLPDQKIYRDAIAALTVGDRGYQVKGGRRSAAAYQLAFEDALTGKLVTQLQAYKGEDLIKRIRSDKAFGNDIVEAMIDGYSGNAAANHAARVFSDTLEQARKLINKQGGDIGKLDGYVPQSYDPSKLIKAGQQSFVDDVLAELDLNKSFPDKTIDEVREIVAESYTTLITGVGSTFSAPNNFNRAGRSSKGAEHSRVFHYKNAAAWQRISQKYSSGHSITAMLRSMHHAAQTAGLMKRFGVNSEDVYGSLKDQVKRSIRNDKSLTDQQRLAHIQSIDGGGAFSLDNQYKLVDGTVDAIGGNFRFANIMQWVRASQSLSKLGGATISSISDLALLSKSIQRISHEGVSSWGQVLTENPLNLTPESKQIASELGAGIDGLKQTIGARFLAEDAPLGGASNVLSTFFKLTGLTQWTDGWRRAGQAMRAHSMGMHSGNAWDDLPESLRDTLGSYGIEPQAWAIMRNAAIDAPDGRRYLLPEHVRGLQDQDFEELVRPQIEGLKLSGEKLEKRTQRLIDEAREDAATKLQIFYSDQNIEGVIEPNARTRALLLGGTQRGTLSGEFLRTLLQFKSFPVAFTTQILLPVFKNEGLPEAFKVIAAMTALGAVSTTLSDITKGKTPQDITQDDFWVRSFMKGGGLGIYADLVYSTAGADNPRSFWSTIAGPAASSLSEAIVAANRGSGWDYVLRYNTPGNNIFYLRAALEAAVFTPLHESQHRGFQRRRARRLKKKTGQKYFIE